MESFPFQRDHFALNSYKSANEDDFKTLCEILGKFLENARVLRSRLQNVDLTEQEAKTTERTVSINSEQKSHHTAAIMLKASN
jgi:hypothetical protein